MSARSFAEEYGVDPTVVVRAPGRVNLIGEHTDYSLLPVLPIAIDRAVVIEAAPGPRHGAVALSLSAPGRLDLALHDLAMDATGWHRYVVAALRVVGPDTAGVRLLVDGDLPSMGGLSSSSALTVGVIAALHHVWDRRLDQIDLVRLAVAAERSMGVEGGAMDQTVIAMAKAGHALRIDFDPWAVRCVSVPDHVAVVVAYSGTPAPKGWEANTAYNLRVVASRAAAACLAHDAGVDSRTPPVLADVFGVVGDGVVDRLPDETSAIAVAHRTGVPVEDLVALTAGRVDPQTPLPLRTVATHVLSEARRVDTAEQALAAGDLDHLGRLVDASHASLRLFGASTGALDRLTVAMRSAGAAGARITGAGFGGFALAVCTPDVVPDVISAATAETGGPAFRVLPSDGVR